MLSTGKSKNAIAYTTDFFHLDMLFGPLSMKIHHDFKLALIASGRCRLLAVLVSHD